MGRLHVTAALGAAVLVVASSASCLDPTQITLSVRTDVRCDATQGTHFSSATDARVAERAAPANATRRCEAGDIGTLVASPTDDKDGRVAFLVVMGVDVPDSECTAANAFKGCIVQRRSLSYVAHTPLDLPIAMLLICKDKVCDANSTCARSGKCVPAEVRDPERCSTSECYPDGDGPEPKPGDDGGTDGPGTGDGGPRDGATSDAAGDAAPDGGFVVPPGRLFCPPQANGCPRGPGDLCCWDRNGGLGTCKPSLLCDFQQIPLSCNQQSDCPAGEYCCATLMFDPDSSTRRAQGSYCHRPPRSNCFGVQLCLQDTDCIAATCNKNTNLFTPPGILGECVVGMGNQ